MYIGLHVKYLLVLSDSNETCIFFVGFSKKWLNTKFHLKTRPLAAKWFHANRRTDVTKLIAAFHNFAIAPKNRHHIREKINERQFALLGGSVLQVSSPIYNPNLYLE
jgi:hypothetical protein